MQAWRALVGALALIGAASCGKPKEEPAAAAAPAAVAPADADQAAVTAPQPIDYSRPESWLCRPEAQDACNQDASATVVTPDGKMTKQAFAADPNAPIDCFYVYPTVSLD